MTQIALVANTDWYLMNYRLSLARLLKERSMKVFLVSPRGPYVGRFEKAGYSWIELPIDRWGMNPVRDFATLLRFISIYRSRDLDLCHHFTMKPILYGSIAAQIVGIQGVVNSVTGLGQLFRSESIRVGIARAVAVQLLRLTSRSARTKFVFQHRDDMDLFIGRGITTASEAVVIRGSGVDLDAFHPTPEPEGTPVVVLVGRMLWQKGVSDLITAAEILQEERVEARFRLVGPLEAGNPAAISRRQLHEWTKRGSIEWVGYQEDMAHVYGQCSIVALPTYYGEGVPKTLLEAAASGRPIVATDIPGCREIVYNGVNGLLVPPRNPQALAEALEVLINRPELRRELGERGREIVEEQFGAQSIDQQTVDLYAEMLGTDGTRES
jgi:glycosyltransferase involved in cell wall biosynthesis